jgi:hypothetical protein
MEASNFIGLSKTSAQNLCEAQSFIFRLISVDGEAFFAYPDDARTDRVCIEIEKGKVSKASIQ